MLTNIQKQVLKKIITAFEENDIAYQATAGLAAIAYGSKRLLYDIDIDVYKKDMTKVKKLFEPYLTRDLFHLEDNYWDGWLMMFEIDGVLVDISQIEDWYYKSPKGEKKLMTAIPENAQMMEVAGIRLPVVKKDVLIDYKRTVARSTDLEDVKQITGG